MRRGGSRLACVPLFSVTCIVCTSCHPWCYIDRVREHVHLGDSHCHTDICDLELQRCVPHPIERETMQDRPNASVYCLYRRTRLAGSVRPAESTQTRSYAECFGILFVVFIVVFIVVFGVCVC